MMEMRPDQIDADEIDADVEKLKRGLTFEGYARKREVREALRSILWHSGVNFREHNL